jgi:hypothetical protein
MLTVGGAETFMQAGLQRLPLLPLQQTMRLMAKAAVSVDEAAAEASGGSWWRRPAARSE